MNEAGTKPLSQFLRMAVMAGVESAVQIHIDRGDDLNARDASGMTPLMLCASRDKPAICKLLVSAGADLGLRDLSGKTALEIALDAGSHATAAILNVAMPPAAASLLTEHNAAPDLDAASDVLIGPIPIAEPSALGDHDSHAAPARPRSPPEPSAREHAQPSAAVANEIGDEEFELSGWESEEETTRPEADLAVVDSASAVQNAITAHQPIDSSAEWDDLVPLGCLLADACFAVACTLMEVEQCSGHGVPSHALAQEWMVVRVFRLPKELTQRSVRAELRLQPLDQVQGVEPQADLVAPSPSPKQRCRREHVQLQGGGDVAKDPCVRCQQRVPANPPEDLVDAGAAAARPFDVPNEGLACQAPGRGAPC